MLLQMTLQGTHPGFPFPKPLAQQCVCDGPGVMPLHYMSTGKPVTVTGGIALVQLATITDASILAASSKGSLLGIPVAWRVGFGGSEGNCNACKEGPC